MKLRLPIPDVIDEAFIKHLLRTKFLYWQYEQEYRAFVSLEEEIDGLTLKTSPPRSDCVL